MTRINLVSCLFTMTLLAAACGGSEHASQNAALDSPAAAGGMEGMQMPPSPTQQPETGMDADLRAHMDMMRGATGDSLAAMLPQHRQMAANMLARMNREMSQMNMTANAAWTATVDSLRQDLTQMPEMGADQLSALMPAHEARLSRLSEMHRSMMANMDM
jgi:hypothetical protein